MFNISKLIHKINTFVFSLNKNSHLMLQHSTETNVTVLDSIVQVGGVYMLNLYVVIFKLNQM